MSNSTDNLKAKPISDQKKEQKFLFQFVNHENGKRSEAFIGNWDSVSETLKHVEKGDRPCPEDFILLVAVLEGKDTKIPATPLITVKTFMQFKQDQDNLKEA